MIARGVRGLAWARRGFPPQRGSISSCVGRSPVLVARILLKLRPLAGPAPPPLRPTGFPTGKLAMASSVVQGQEDRRGK